MSKAGSPIRCGAELGSQEAGGHDLFGKLDGFEFIAFVNGVVFVL